MAGFRPSTYNLGRFNSATSSEFINFYNDFVDQKLIKAGSEKSSQTFAPSSFKCRRKLWFRLRGTQPDVPSNVDRVLQFKADVGTGCHAVIQSRMKEALGIDWIDVETYINKNKNFLPYPDANYTITRNGLETLVQIDKPAWRFACDGIIRWKGRIYILEIKTIEYSAFVDLLNPRANDIDQSHCYTTLLNVDAVLFMYQERNSGDIKCYELVIHKEDKDHIISTVDAVVLASEQHLAPPALLVNDRQWCSRCEYKSKCIEWGRK